VHRQQRRHSTTSHIWIRSLLTLALLALFVAPAWAGSASPVELPCAQVIPDAASGWPATLRDCQMDAGSADSPETLAGAFLKTHHSALGLDKDLATLRLISTRHGLDSSHLVYQQTLSGRPVYGAYLSVHLDRQGQLQVLHNRTLPDLKLPNTSASISAVEAVQRARTAIQFGAPRGDSPAPELMALPMDGESGRLVWRVLIAAAQPQGDWEVLLDASTGEVIKRYNRLVLARGQVLDAASPPPARDAALPLRTLTLQGLDGSGWLRGDYVDVTQPVGYRPATAFSPDGDFLYQPDDPRFKEVMVYYHIDAAQRYVQALGYSDGNDPPNGIRDRVTYASPHWFALDQSFYSVSDDALHFGDGGWPDALDPDIIVHEYGHALLHDLAPHWGGGEMATIGEGFGDYLAATLFGETSADPACIGEWDVRGSTSDASACLRRVDRDRQFPHDLTGDAHADGEIWSRVLWDLRAAVGAEVADTLALESSFYLPPAATMVEAGQALLDADANLLGGLHHPAIMEALQARGLARLPAPELILPAGGDILRPGGLRAVAWQTPVDLPLSYDLEWSLNASAAGARQIDFNAGLPADSVPYGHAPWRAAAGLARSGLIGHGQSSSLALPVETLADGRVSFRYRVDSEHGYDRFEFLVNGQVVLRASGQADWQTFGVPLPAGQHELVWRYSKDNTLSSGEDAAWIDGLQIEQASLAEWRPAEIDPKRAASGEVLWRVPNQASSDASLRVRVRLDAVASPWSASGLLTIDEPTAVSLASFEAGMAQTLAGQLPTWAWGLLVLTGTLVLAVSLRGLLHRRA
jgi:hypothetical protein